MNSRPTWMYIAFGAIILIYFFSLSYRGLSAFFSGDDLMNIQFLHGYGQRPVAMLLVQAAVVATPEYRPVGGLVYRALFSTFGLHPLPYRLFCYALFLVNLTFAAFFFRAVARSVRVALFATLLFSFHACMADLYFNTGTLYDILCFTFAVAAMGHYAAVRQSGQLLSGRGTLLVLALYCLALDSKEMAVTVPLILIAYEAVFHGRETIAWRRLLPLVIASGITGIYLLVKTKTPNVISTNILYQPRLSPSFVLEQVKHYYSLLLFGAPMGAVGLLAALGALFALAFLFRNRSMIFGLLFANIALIPVCVIPGRGGFVWYLAFVGWALFWAAALLQVVDEIFERIRGVRVETSHPTTADLLLFVALAAALFAIQAQPSRGMGKFSLPQQAELRAMLDAERRSLPSLPKGSRLLIAEDQFGDVSWLPLFLTRLAYRDATLWVDRVPQLGAAYDPRDLAAYAGVIIAKADSAEARPGTLPVEGAPIPIEVEPEVVHRGLDIRISLPAAHHGCRVDVEYRLPEDELARSGIWQNWCTLDETGHCQVRVGQDAERGEVKLQRVRLCSGQWASAQGSFAIVP